MTHCVTVARRTGGGAFRRTRGRYILYNWPVVGWCLGVVEVANIDGKRKVGGEVVNAIVFYEINGEHGAHVLCSFCVLLQPQAGGVGEVAVVVDDDSECA